MKSSLLFLLCCICSFSVYPLSKSDSLLKELDQEIEKSQTYLKKKTARIDSLKSVLAINIKKQALLPQYELRDQLFEEYKSFVYDSAFTYATELLKTAYQLGDTKKINEAKVKVSFTLLSAGMFKEALDTLELIDPAALTASWRAEYYAEYARTYFDMADFAQDRYYSEIYNTKGNQLLQLALSSSEPGTVQFLLLKGLEYMKYRDLPNAINTFLVVLSNKNITLHQYAVASSSVSYMYRLDKKTEKAKEYLAQAAIADIKSSIRETVAIRDLAEILYNDGDVDRSYRFVKIALEDAYFYGAKHRKIQIANILPIIEGTQLNIVEEQKKSLYTYLLILAGLSILVIVFAFIIFQQNGKLQLAQSGLKESHSKLQELNARLQDANTIKEEYIGSFFKIISEQVDRIEKIKTSVDRKLSQKKIDEIRDIVNAINIKSEREQLYLTFDSIFLKIFPGFIDQFNAHFKKEDQFVIGEKDALPTELRIFALIRLGINDNEKIARILDYSVNTIYTYKTKTKNKSFVSNEDFEEKLMEIRAI